MLGYPALFPLKAPPIYRDRGGLCNALFGNWTAPEREAIRNAGFNLSRVILEATQAAGADIEYVDISSHFAGHEPCSTGGEWVRFIGLLNSAVRDGSFHPLADGQRMMARIVSCHLDVFPTADTPRTKTTNYAMTGCVAKETVEVVTTPEPAATPTERPTWYVASARTPEPYFGLFARFSRGTTGTLSDLGPSRVSARLRPRAPRLPVAGGRHREHRQGDEREIRPREHPKAGLGPLDLLDELG